MYRLVGLSFQGTSNRYRPVACMANQVRINILYDGIISNFRVKRSDRVPDIYQTRSCVEIKESMLCEFRLHALLFLKYYIFNLALSVCLSRHLVGMIAKCVLSFAGI